MWRFILLTFGLLGLAFYQASGGADFDPQAERAAHFARLQAEASDQEARRLAEIEKNRAVTDQNRSDQPAGVQVAEIIRIRDVVPESVPVEPQVSRSSFNPEALPLIKADSVQLDTALTSTEAATAVQVIEALPAADLRQVSASRVNMRMGPGTSYNVVTKLTRNTEVEVLQNPGEGWVKLRVTESGRIGWMAERLLTAQVN